MTQHNKTNQGVMEYSPDSLSGSPVLRTI